MIAHDLLQEELATSETRGCAGEQTGTSAAANLIDSFEDSEIPTPKRVPL
jgi:hypothetical protein